MWASTYQPRLLGLASKLAELLHKGLQLEVGQFLLAEEDNIALRDGDGDVPDELVGVGRIKDLSDLDCGELASKDGGDVELLVLVEDACQLEGLAGVGGFARGSSNSLLCDDLQLLKGSGGGGNLGGYNNGSHFCRWVLFEDVWRAEDV